MHKTHDTRHKQGSGLGTWPLLTPKLKSPSYFSPSGKVMTPWKRQDGTSNMPEGTREALSNQRHRKMKIAEKAGMFEV